MPVYVLVADGVRPDTLAAALDDGTLPALARLRAEGGLHTVTSAFPSVTGPAYAPFLLGRYPGPIGLPGLRWYDRARSRRTFPDYTRSYVGAEMRHVDADLDPSAPTIFELVPRSLAALNVIGRGLTRRQRIGQGVGFILRAARTHFSGDVAGWLGIDRAIAREFADGVRRERPAFAFAALTGVDKTSHSQGHDAPIVREALTIVDSLAAELRADAEARGEWEATHLWIVSDHGHSPVRAHEDLIGLVRANGHAAIAHPFVHRARRADVAVMVSGNAMAHLYLELGDTTRPWWPALAPRWRALLDTVLARDSVDLALLPLGESSCEIATRTRGRARLSWADRRLSYHPMDGDPLGIGELRDVSEDAAWDATRASDYPDAPVQIAHLAAAARSGEIILSATPGWDFRARYEPIPHVSSHGALHRDHMLVPLLLNRPVARTPRRTVDVMPTALQALGIAIPAGLDGVGLL